MGTSIPSAPLATPSAAGLMSAAQAASLARLGTGMFPTIQICTPLIDWTQTGTTPIPGVLPGFAFVAGGGRIIGAAHAGTFSTGATFSVGNDAGHTNCIPSATPAVTFTGTPPSYDSGTTTISPGQSLVDLATQMSLKITVGAAGTGGFAWTGYLVIYGYIAPSS